MNWPYYQNLSRFGGLTAEEVLDKNGINGHEVLIKYTKDKDMRKL
jgi:hypothetical protein